ncbi:transposase family protein [Rugosimonospora africana]|uniref:transposase family protein n=1 Tax=Rugosimonospora africana TaxID=556532 RepID=UPI00194287EE
MAAEGHRRYRDTPGAGLPGKDRRPHRSGLSGADRYIGKRHDFGGNIQAVMCPDGMPIWVSAVEPGSVHDLVAAHEHALGALYAAAARGLPRWPTRDTPARVSACTLRSSSPPTHANWASTTAIQRAAALSALSRRTRLRAARGSLAGT